MRVLSPRMLPPEIGLDGSTLSTATRSPRSRTRCMPSASMKVLLPTPGTPVMPTRRDRPACGKHRVEQRRRGVGVRGALALDERDGAREDRAVAAEHAVDVRREGQSRRRHAARVAPSASRICCAQIGMTLPGPNTAVDAGLLEERVVLRRDDAADDDQDVLAAELPQFRDHLGDERLVAARQGRDAEHVHVVLHGHARRLARRLEQRPDVDVEAEIGKRRGDDLRAAVVAVLAQLGHEDARTPPLVRRRTARPSAAPSGTRDPARSPRSTRRRWYD